MRVSADMPVTARDTKRFPRDHRLLCSADYTGVFEDNAFRKSSRQLLLLARHNELAHPRLGLVVAKRHVNKAVDRNRMKRLIRESFRINQHRLVGVDIVVLVRPGLAQQSNQVVFDSLMAIWDWLEKELCKCAR